MDEPLLGVDPIGREDIQDLIIDLVKKEGKTVLLVTHSLEEAKRMCDRVAIIDKGRILTELDNPKEKDLSAIFKRVVKE
jgi:ABC-2 type transport system ATP-binding protein